MPFTYQVAEIVLRNGGIIMTAIQKQSIADLRARGDGYAKIAGILGISVNTIKSYCQRNKLGGIKSATEITSEYEICKNCGQRLVNHPGRKKKKFCCNDCRAAWWASHPESLNRKATYSFSCSCCGADFTAYGNKSRKFCTHACYVIARFGKAVPS